ncbi:thaumatin-like protein 1b [Carex littledalei]|uniref:Thaumatin-like protein 1b n=1 Tax=Carex littledalei TaxID=544730 RepID=A0A833VRI7_9POAL|nr:thaumatin-like protein 1b [Carex littledalei]
MATLFSLLLLFSAFLGAQSTFKVTNNCGYTIWPGILSNAGLAPLTTTGFQLQPGETRVIEVPASWSGRLWARTLCTSDPTSGKFSCATGDCGSGTVECGGGGAAPPVSLVEFTLNGGGNNDFYDVSLVDGYNIALVVFPQGGSGPNCVPTGCIVELNGPCPEGLRVVTGGQTIACKSACEAFSDPRYCCSGAYGNPNTCGPTSYSLFFKNACPRAYSYAYDDATSTFTCASGTAQYLLSFCPNSSSLRSSGGNNPEAAGVPLINDTMIFSDGSQSTHYFPNCFFKIFFSVFLVLSWLTTHV